MGMEFEPLLSEIGYVFLREPYGGVQMHKNVFCQTMLQNTTKCSNSTVALACTRWELK